MSLQPLSTDKARRNQAMGQASRQPPAGYAWCAVCVRRFMPVGDVMCHACYIEKTGHRRPTPKQTKPAEPQRAAPGRPEGTVIRTYIIRGIRHDVVWDGT